MRQILRGYTCWIAGVDYGYEIEELQVALPDETYLDHDYGGTIMSAQVPIIRVGNLEPTIKFQSHNPDVVGMLMRPPGIRDTFTFRGALVDEIDGTTRANVITYEGRLAAPSPDAWSRNDKSGIGYTIKGIFYFRYEVQNETVLEIGLMPQRMVIRGVDRLAAVNAALGR